MALKFNDTQGKAQKGVDAYQYKDGDNVVRLFGDVLPRYVYWLKTKDGKSIPVECLAFDREKEKFTGVEKDWVKHYFPEEKCSWAYAMQGLVDGEVKTINLKKKLFEAIRTTASDLGDPTDPVKGWDVSFKKVKTGSLAFNVEYQLQPLRCKVRPLTDDEKEKVASATGIDEVYPRLTSDDVKRIIEEQILGGDTDETVPTADSDEPLEDIPY